MTQETEGFPAAAICLVRMALVIDTVICGKFDQCCKSLWIINLSLSLSLSLSVCVCVCVYVRKAKDDDNWCFTVTFVYMVDQMVQTTFNSYEIK